MSKEIIEISESWSGEDTTHLLAAVKGWKDPDSADTLLDQSASVCKSLDGIAAALNRIADALEKSR